VNTLREKLIHAPFIVSNQNLYEISVHSLKIKSHDRFSRLSITQKSY